MTDFFSSIWNFTNTSKPYYELRDVYVHHSTGLIFGSDGNPIFELLYEFLYWYPGTIPSDVIRSKSLMIPEIARRYVKVHEFSVSLKNQLEFESEIESFEEFVYLLHCFGWYAFGHLQDTTMRLHSLPAEFKLFEKKLLCSDFRRISDFNLHVLALGGDPDKIVDRRNLSEFIFVESLHVGVNPAPPTTFTSDSYNWMIAGYEGQFSTTTASLPGIYLSRNHVRPGERGVLNNNQVETFLKKRGYLILDGTESLGRIVDLFSRAEVVVGPHGSLFANSIYCKENARIIEYCPKSRPEFSQKNKYKRATDYTQIMLDADVKHNIEIDIDEMARLI